MKINKCATVKETKYTLKMATRGTRLLGMFIVKHKKYENTLQNGWD